MSVLTTVEMQMKKLIDDAGREYFDLSVGASFGPMPKVDAVMIPFFAVTYTYDGEIEIDRVYEDSPEFVKRFDNDKYFCQEKYLLMQLSHYLCEYLNHVRDFDHLKSWIEQSRIAKYENDKGADNGSR